MSQATDRHRSRHRVIQKNVIVMDFRHRVKCPEELARLVFMPARHDQQTHGLRGFRWSAAMGAGSGKGVHRRSTIPRTPSNKRNPLTVPPPHLPLTEKASSMLPGTAE